MKKVLLFLSSFIIATGAAAALYLGVVAPEGERQRIRASLDNPRAQMSLARDAFLGTGREKNEAEGAAWVKRAAENGSSRAAALMGILSLGGIGVSQDHEAAIKWLKQSQEPEAKDLAARLEAQKVIIDALPPEERAARWGEFYAQTESEVRADFDRILAREK